MQTLLFAFAGLLLVVVAMSVGVLMGRKPISGSCGGIGAALGRKTTPVISAVVIQKNAMSSRNLSKNKPGIWLTTPAIKADGDIH